MQLGFPADEVWIMRFGFLLDLIECHRQFSGIAKPKDEAADSIDDIIPIGF